MPIAPTRKKAGPRTIAKHASGDELRVMNIPAALGPAGPAALRYRPAVRRAERTGCGAPRRARYAGAAPLLCALLHRARNVEGRWVRLRHCLVPCLAKTFWNSASRRPFFNG